MRDDDKWSLVFVVGAKRVDGGCVGCLCVGWMMTGARARKARPT